MQYNFIPNKLVPAQRAATELLKAYFASPAPSNNKLSPNPESMLISTPTLNGTFHHSISSSALVVQLFSWAPLTSAKSRFSNESSKLNSASLNSLVAALSRLFSSAQSETQEVPVQLRIVRLHHPYLNSSILAQFLALNASKYGFARLRQYVLTSIPLATISNSNTGSTQNVHSGVLGVKVQVSGLLTTQRMAPRKTVSTVSAGTFHGPGTHVDYSSHTSKSALGSYTVKVWLCTN